MISSSEAETIRIGEEIGRELKRGDVVGLYGEFGAGKTVLTKGIAKGIGCEEGVKSPSFNYVHEYRGRLPIYHIDLYRVNTIDDILCLGIAEFFDLGGVCLIEWAERAKGLLPDGCINVEVKILNEKEREIIVK